MGVCTFFDKSMKVLSSILAMATAQWDGFNYDDYSDVGKNQISQSSVNDVAGLNGQSGAVLSAYQAANHYLGNGLKCFYCNERSVGDCFTKSTFSVCQGQEYFCFFHERRKISHFFNRREKYIDNFASTNNDVFLARSANEAFNLNPSANVASDRDAPSTQVHVRLVVNNHRLVSVNNLRTIQLPLVLNFTDLVLIPLDRASFQLLDVMSVRVSAVWAKTGLTTVVTIGSMMIKLKTTILPQMVVHTN